MCECTFNLVCLMSLSLLLYVCSTYVCMYVTYYMCTYVHNMYVFMSSSGRSYSVGSQKSLVQSLESITQKLHPGVVVCFRKIGYNPSESSQAVASDLPFPTDTSERDHVVKTEAEPTPHGMVRTDRLVTESYCCCGVCNSRQCVWVHLHTPHSWSSIL